MRIRTPQNFREIGRRLKFVLIFQSGTLPEVEKSDFRVGNSVPPVGFGPQRSLYRI